MASVAISLLPPALLKRQARRELERAILEIRSAGFGEDDIRAHENELRRVTGALATPRLNADVEVPLTQRESEAKCFNRSYSSMTCPLHRSRCGTIPGSSIRPRRNRPPLTDLPYFH
ncbi:hypothetical protein AB1L30_01195, partial [Bremerella sp. JC817]